MPTALLHIGADQTTVVLESDAEPAAAVTFPIGSRKTAADYFKHVPPTPGEVENAIAAVEDAIAHARTIILPGSTLATADADILEIARFAGVSAGPAMVFTRDAVERSFERLAAVTLGRPASVEGIPDNAEFAATLLILRELMHHMQFPAITVKPG